MILMSTWKTVTRSSRIALRQAWVQVSLPTDDKACHRLAGNRQHLVTLLDAMPKLPQEHELSTTITTDQVSKATSTLLVARPVLVHTPLRHHLLFHRFLLLRHGALPFLLRTIRNTLQPVLRTHTANIHLLRLKITATLRVAQLVSTTQFGPFQAIDKALQTILQRRINNIQLRTPPTNSYLILMQIMVLPPSILTLTTAQGT